MMTSDNISKLYKAFNAKYDNFETEDEFRNFVNTADAQKMQKLYDAFNAKYDNFESADDLKAYVGWKDPSAHAGKEAGGSQGLDAQDKGRESIGSDARAGGSPSQPSSPAESEKEGGWNPTWQQREAAIGNVRSAVSGFDARSKGMVESVKNISDYAQTPAALTSSTAKVRGVNGDTEYITPFGLRTDDEMIAKSGTAAYRDALDRTVTGQLRHAYEDMAEVNRRIAEEESKQKDKRDKIGMAAFMPGSTPGMTMELNVANYDLGTNSEYAALIATRNSIEKRIKTLKQEKDRQMGKDVGFWRGMYDTMNDASLWDWGASDLRAVSSAYKINEKQKNGDDLTEGERMMLEAEAEAEAVESEFGSNGNWRQKGGELSGYMIPFMGDMMVGGPITGSLKLFGKVGTKLAIKTALGTGRRAAVKAGMSGLKDYLKVEGLKGLAHYGVQKAAPTLIKATGKALDKIALEGLMGANTIQAGKTLADIGRRKLGDVEVDEETGELKYIDEESWARAIYQGEVNAAVEYGSERLGEGIDKGLGKMANMLGLDKVGKAAKRYSGLEAAEAYLTKVTPRSLAAIRTAQRELGKRFALSGIIGEVGEEYSGQAWRTVLGSDDAWTLKPVLDSNGNQMLDQDGNPMYEKTNLMLDADFHRDLWTGMPLSMAMLNGAGFAVETALHAKGVRDEMLSYYRMRKNVIKADNTARKLLGEDLWSPMREVIDGTENKDVMDFVELLEQDDTLSKEKKTAVKSYLANLLAFRGYNLMSLKAAREGTEGYEQLMNVYIGGYDTSDAKERRRIQNDYDEARREFEGYRSDEFGGMTPEEKIKAMLGVEDPSDSRAVARALYGEKSTVSEADRKALEKYLYAEYMHSGMMDKFSDSVDEEVSALRDELEQNVNKTTGTFDEAMTPDGRKIYVVGGHVEMDDDGKMVDSRRSDEQVYVRDAETGKMEAIDPTTLASVRSTEAKPIIDGAVAQKRAEMEQEYLSELMEAEKESAESEASEKSEGETGPQAGGSASVDESTEEKSSPSLEAKDYRVQDHVVVRREDGLEVDAMVTDIDDNGVIEVGYKQGQKIHYLRIKPEEMGERIVEHHPVPQAKDEGAGRSSSVDESAVPSTAANAAENVGEAQAGRPLEAKPKVEEDAQAGSLPSLGESVESTESAQAGSLPSLSESEKAAKKPDKSMDGREERAGSSPSLTALSRVPYNEERKDYDYESVDADTAFDAITEQVTDPNVATQIANDMVTAIENDIKAEEKKPSTGVDKIAKELKKLEESGTQGGSVAERIAFANQKAQAVEQKRAELKAAEEVSAEKVAAMREQLGKWQAIAGVQARREAEREAEQPGRVAQAIAEAQAEAKSQQKADVEESPIQQEAAEAAESQAGSLPSLGESVESTESAQAGSLPSLDEKPTGTVESVDEESVENTHSLFTYFQGSLSELISKAKEKTQKLIKKIVAPVSDRLRKELQSQGVSVDKEYNHVIDNNAILHTLKQHGGKSEDKRGQIPITETDFEKIPDVVENYDEVSTSKTKRGEDSIVYKKEYSDGTVVYVEEVRTGRKELAAVTMWKTKKSALTDANSAVTTQISDLSGSSEGKGSDFASEKQGGEEKGSSDVGELLTLDDIDLPDGLSGRRLSNIGADARTAFRRAVLNADSELFDGKDAAQREAEAYEAFTDAYREIAGEYSAGKDEQYLKPIFDHFNNKLNEAASKAELARRQSETGRKHNISDEKTSETTTQNADTQANKVKEVSGAIAEFARALGREVSYEGDFKGSNERGYVENGVIHINPNMTAAEQAAFVLGHEFAHTLEGSEAYDALARYIKGSELMKDFLHSRTEQLREQGATNLDAAEEATTRMDNLAKARQMEARFKEIEGSEEHQRMVEAAEKVRGLKPVALDDVPSNRDKKACEAIVEGLADGENIQDGRIVRFVKGTVGKLLGHKGFDYSILIPKLTELYDNSVPVFFEKEEVKPGHKDHTSNFVGYHHYVNKVSLGGKEYYVRFTVQEQKTRKKDYIPNEMHSAQVSEVMDIDIISADGHVHSGIIDPATFDSIGAKADAKLRNFFILASGDAKTFAQRLKMATGWQRGADGEWQYEESEDAGIRFRTSEALFEEYPTWLSGQTTESGQHTTQITSTKATYKKIGEHLVGEGVDPGQVSVLDASSGLGVGTQALREMGFDVEDVEPYPSDKRSAPTYSRYEDIDKRYDVVISNAVLNVIPDDWRSDVLKSMADKLKVGGRLFINVRDAAGVAAQKQKIELDSPSEILVTDKNGNIRAYQKGFTKKELLDYVREELGEEYDVEIANAKNSGIANGTAVVVTRKTEEAMRYRTISSSERGREAERYTKKTVEQGFGGIWIEDKQEFAKFASATVNNRFEKDGEGVCYTDNHFYAYYRNIDGEAVPFIQVNLNAEDSQELVQRIQDIRRNDVAGAFDNVVAGIKSSRTSGDADLRGANEAARVSDRLAMSLDSAAIRRGKYADNPRNYVKDVESVRPTDNRDGGVSLGSVESVVGAGSSPSLEEKPTDRRSGDLLSKGEKSKVEAAQALAERLGKKVRIVTDVNEVKRMAEYRRASDEKRARMLRSQGWINTATGEIVVVIPNNLDVADVKKTVLHEVVGHYGLQQMVGKENFKKFLSEVFKHSDKELRAKITDLAKRRGWDYQLATEEFIAGLAERGFEDMDEQERSLWQKIKDLVQGLLDELLGDTGARYEVSEKDLRYMLWRSYQKMQSERDGVHPAVAEAENVMKQRDLGNESVNESYLQSVNERFITHLEKLNSGEEQNGELKLGRPGDILRSAGIDGDGIFLQWNVLQKKMSEGYKHEHPFSIEDIKNLPIEINRPLAVFKSKGHGDFNILVNLEKDGRNFIVSLKAHKKAIKGGEILVDDIVTLYPKEVKGIINWINLGLGRFYDKEKVLEWLRTCETHNRHSAIEELKDAAKVIKDFENPKIETDEDAIKFRDAEITQRELLDDAFKDAEATINKMGRRETDRKKLQEARDAVARYIRKIINAESVPAMKKMELNGLLSAVKKVGSRRELESHLRKVESIMWDIESRRERRAIDKLLGKKLLEKNSGGVSVGKSVDDPTRKALEIVKGRLSAIRATDMDAELHSLGSEIYDLQRRQREGEQIDADYLDQIKAERDKLREEREKLRQQNSVDAQSDIEARIGELEALMADPTHDFTEAEAKEYGALTAVSMLNEASLMESVGVVDSSTKVKSESIASVNSQREKLTEEIGNLRKQRGATTDAAAKQALSTEIDRKKLELENLEVIENSIKEKQNNLYRESREILTDLVESGRDNLKQQMQAEAERRREIVAQACREIDRGKDGTWEKDWRGRRKYVAPRDRERRSWLSNFRHAFYGYALDSFDYMTQQVSKAQMGLGWIYNHFIDGKDGLTAAKQARNMAIYRDKEMLDAKCKDLFDGMTFKVVAKKYSKLEHETGVYVHPVDDNGNPTESFEMPMSKGTAMYLHQLWNMNDGRMKLAKMGFTEESMAQIDAFLGQTLIDLADWMVSDYYPQIKDRMNAVHRELYYTSLADVANYVPIKIDSSAVKRDSNLTEGESYDDSLKKKNGSIVNRTVNVLPIDLSRTAFDVLAEHTNENEEWIAFSRVRQDLSYLLSSTAFRDIMNTNKHGRFNEFVEAARIASLLPVERPSKFDQVAGIMSAPLVAGAIAFRWWTAAKQLLSYPAFLSYSQNPKYLWMLGKNLFTPMGKIGDHKGNYDWAKENLPIFRERIEQGLAASSDLEREIEGLKEGRYKRVLRVIAKGGMWANKMIDALTCAAGARAIYNLEYERAKGRGYSDEEAHGIAMRRAEVAFNETQQSNLGTMKSAAQMSKAMTSKALTLFQQANIGYTRKSDLGVRTIARGIFHRDEQIKMLMERVDGLDKKDAARIVDNKTRLGFMEIVVNGFLVKILWDKAPGIAGWLLLGLATLGGGDDDDDKEKEVAEKYGAVERTDLDDDETMLAKAAVYASYLAQGTPGGNIVHDGVSYNPASIFSPKEVKKLSKVVDDYGVSSWEAVGQLVSVIAEYNGVEPETFANIFQGSLGDMAVRCAIDQEQLEKAGYRPDLASNVALVVNLPKSARKNYMRKQSGRYTPMEYAEALDYATRSRLSADRPSPLSPMDGKDLKKHLAEYEAMRLTNEAVEVWEEFVASARIVDARRGKAGRDLSDVGIFGWEPRDRRERQVSDVVKAYNLANKLFKAEIEKGEEMDKSVVNDMMAYKIKSRNLAPRLAAGEEVSDEIDQMLSSLKEADKQTVKESRAKTLVEKPEAAHKGK